MKTSRYCVEMARRLWGPLTLTLLLASTPCAAQPPQPLMQCVFPAGGQRGRTFEATVSGANLQGADSVHISGSGVTAKVIEAKPDSVRISVSIALGAELGQRDIRVRTPGGVSTRYRFLVGDLPEVNEVEPNNEKGQAQRLDFLPVLVNGRVLENDRDYFRFAAKAGQTIVAAVQGRTLLPYIPDTVPGWLDACLTLYDAQGNELSSVDDYELNPDPVLIFAVPKDGEYLLELRDILYRGRATFVYRLSLGPLPYLTHVFPLGGQRNSTVMEELHGVNLPVASFPFLIPADSPPLRGLALPGPGLASNGVPFAVSEMPEALEAEPNDSLAQANRVDVPCAINGRIQRRGDNDYFVFAAQAGQTLAMEVQARRLGSPLDSMLYLLNAQGGELARNDDWVDPIDSLLTHHADSRIVYTFPAAADYVLRIKDVQQNGGDEYGYRLVIAPPRHDFALGVSPDNPRLTKGDTAILTVRALRLDGFPGEINLAVANLPAGFVASDAVIPAGQEQTRISISAPPNATVGVLAPSVVGTATIGNAPAVRTALATEQVMQAFSLTHTVPTKELALAVIEPALLTLSTNVAPAKPLEVRPASEVQVIVNATRHAGAAGVVSLTLDGPPPWLSLKSPPVTIPADKSEAIVTLVLAKEAPVGQRLSVWLSGTLNTGKETATRLAPAVSLKVLPAQ